MKSSRASRKTRTRIRRPKYVSLRLQLSPSATTNTTAEAIPDDDMKLKDLLLLKRPATTITTTTTAADPGPVQLEVEKLDHDQSNMAARLFSNMDGCGAASATLTDILKEEESEMEEERGSVSSCWASRSASSAASAGSRRGSLLERAALRSSVRREDEEETRWVRMSEVVGDDERNKGEKSRYREQEEVSSCVDQGQWHRTELGRATTVLETGWWWPDRIRGKGAESGGSSSGGGGMLLKLDYGEVMNAWGDRGGGGPFCWDFEDGGGVSGGGDQDSPQTVPDLQHQSVQSLAAGAVWTVPVDDQQHMKTISSGAHHQDQINNGELEAGAAAAVAAGGQGITTTRALREASILRYKEKRMNRLFSKKIRYQVRKLNAEKRPRIKGRFVKRD